MSDSLDDSTTIRSFEPGPKGEPRLVPALTIISHAYMARAGERLILDALRAGQSVEISRNSPEFKRRGDWSGKPLDDPGISRKPFTLALGSDGGVVFRVDEGGAAVSVAGERVVGERQLGPAALAAGVPLMLSGRVLLLLHLVDLDGDGPEDMLGMVGESAGLRQVRQQIRNVRDLDVPVLLRGETGTGKERVAQALHEHGPRKKGPFVAVNLASFAKELVASELFGVKRGAFTGATQDRDGFFQAAQDGTLFLDEVGEASPEVQVTLLRVLETGMLYPVGATSPVRVNVRLVAATDADLEARVQAGQFRAPLLFRLAGYQIQLPPLRERPEDIGLLFAHFAEEELRALKEPERLVPRSKEASPWLPADLALELVRCPWKGNVRQLRNVTRQLIIDNRGREMLRASREVARELGITPRPETPSGPVVVAQAHDTSAARRKPSEVARDELVRVLRECEWEYEAAAEKLRVTRASVYNLIEKDPELRLPKDLTEEEIRRCHQECGGKLKSMVQRLEVSRLALRRRAKELGLEVDES